MWTILNIAQMGCLILRLKGPPIIIDRIFVLSKRMVILWLFAANYDDSNFYFMIFIVESFLSALVFIFISILLQGYRESWFFLHSLLFGKNAYREETNSRVGEQSWRMGRIVWQRMGVRTFVLAPTSLNMQIWLVK